MIGSLNLLGSTGSIGVQTLKICDRHGVRIGAMTANRNIGLLAQQARAFLPYMAVTADLSLYNDLKTALADTSVKVMAGSDAVLEAAACNAGEMTLNAIVGIAGLRPTMAALMASKPLALANKESLVAGGEFVMREAVNRNVPILPVDSEHSAIFQCLNSSGGNRINKIILTASGGPFFGWSIDKLSGVTPKDALKHPTYSMGAKISIDSATLMNKGLELIEAMWLFDVGEDKIEIVIHPQSIIHSAVEYEDGAVIAQMGLPDMALPIQYALTYPRRLSTGAAAMSLADIGRLTFHKPEPDVFLCLSAAKKAARMGGTVPAVLNGANEEAVSAFLQGKIAFTRIGELVHEALCRVNIALTGLDSVFDADMAAREVVRGLV